MLKAEQEPAHQNTAERQSEGKIQGFLEKSIHPYTDNQLIRQAIARRSRAPFVEDKYLDHIWTDAIIPINGATMSQPSLVARMMDFLELDGTGSVFEVGTGSGWLALLLADCAETVHTTDISDELVRRAETIVRTQGNDSIHFHVGDGVVGLPDHAPFQRIIVTAAARSMPIELLKQLDPNGGKMVLPMGDNYAHCTLMQVTRNGGTFGVINIEPVRFMPLMSNAPGGWTQQEYDEVTQQNDQQLATLIAEIASVDDLDVLDMQNQIREGVEGGDKMSLAEINRHLLSVLEDMGILEKYFLHKMQADE